RHVGRRPAGRRRRRVAAGLPPRLAGGACARDAPRRPRPARPRDRLRTDPPPPIGHFTGERPPPPPPPRRPPLHQSPPPRPRPPLLGGGASAEPPPRRSPTAKIDGVAPGRTSQTNIR